MTQGWQGNAVRRAVALGLVRSRANRGRIDSNDPLLAELEAASRRGSAVDRARWLEAKAMLLRGQGKPDESAAIYREALLAARRSGQKEFRAVIANNLATALLDAGDVAGAAEAIAEAEAFTVRASLYGAYLLGTKAELALAQGDLAGAQVAIDQSGQLKYSGGATGGLGWTRAIQARLAVAKDDLAGARLLLADAAPVLQDLAAIRTWEAAAAVALPGSTASLCEALADPLVDRAKAAAKPVSKAVGDIQQNLQWVVAISLLLAAGWLTRYIPLWSAGSLFLNVAALALLLVIGYWYLRGRMARR